MVSDAVERWLKRRQRRILAASWFYCGVAVTGGCIVALLNTTLFFLAVKTLILLAWPATQWVDLWSLSLALALAALLFFDCLRTDRDDMSVIPLWLAREYIHCGPRMILEGLRNGGRALRFGRIDVPRCAAILTYLAGRRRPVMRSELLRAFPGLDWPGAVAQLANVEGVILFRPNSERVSLTLPFRLQLLQLLEDRRAPIDPGGETEAAQAPETLDPCEILSVSPDASAAQIKAAYRNRIKECHPDRFAHLDDASRKLAEEWTKALNGAYAKLMAARRAESRPG